MATLNRWGWFMICLLGFASFNLYFTVDKNVDLPVLAPSNQQMNILSSIDGEFTFRVIAFYLQHLGDTTGMRPALSDYNYSRLYQWFKVADELNDQSDFMPALALFYYGGTSTLQDRKLMEQFVLKHARKHPVSKHRWLRLLHDSLPQQSQ